jgi:hypothetical protein
MVVFFLTINLFSGMLIGSGAADTLGLSGQVELGGDDKTQKTLNQSNKTSTGAPTGSTLFGLYNVLAGALTTMYNVVFAGPVMLNNAGVPSALTNMLSLIIGTVYAMGLISFLRGYDF